ncbi:MAG: HAMP domain-containing histidine kinase [FCB group bacterium]|nr:HAMP domain-containing histidine kinase [FCB group bacterium]
MNTPPQIQTYITISIGFFIGFTLLILYMLVDILKKKAFLKKAQDDLQEYALQLKKAKDTIEVHNEHLEELLESRTKELVRSERQAAFGQLIQGIVHNLNNPLNGIYTSIQIIQEKLQVFEKSGDNYYAFTNMADYENLTMFSQLIRGSSERLAEMISSLMAKSRSDKSDKIEISDLNEIVKLETKFLEADHRFKHDTVKDFSLAESRLPVEVNPSEISQVFQNLIKNALDAMHENEVRELYVSTDVAGKFARLIIQDSGPGISPEVLAKLFDPFFTTKPRAGSEKDDEPVGTGLGLHMCRETIKSYDGRIEVESQIGNGAKFIVLLPLYMEKTAV